MHGCVIPVMMSAFIVRLEELSMPRLPEIDPATTSGYVASILKAQTDTFGAPLRNHLLYAYRPDFFRAARAMWNAMDKDEILGTPLVSLVNRRVASLNGCVF